MRAKQYHIMKKFLSMVLALSLALCGFIAKAEDGDHPGCYNRISMSYRNVHFSDLDNGVSYNGGSFNYLHGFGLSATLPIYIETGASLGFATRDNDSGSWGGYGTLEVPVNCTYRFSIPNTELRLLPFAGLNFKGNLMGTADVASDTQEWFTDSDFRRFQLGWQIGGALEFKKLYAALSYGTDFIPIAKGVNTGTFALSIGLNL